MNFLADGTIINHKSSIINYGVVVPVYNSAERLPELLTGIAAAQQACRRRLLVLIVDDGSEPPLPPLQHAGLDIRQLRHEGNRGKGAALKSGFAHLMQQTDVPALLTLDADLQHPPVFIPQFIELFEQGGGELIIGIRRRDPRQMPPHRIASNYLTSRIISLLGGQRVADSQCGYRLYSRALLGSIQAAENRFHLESEFVVRAGWAGLRIGEVPIPTIYNGAPSAIRHIGDTLNFVGLTGRLLRERIMRHV